MPRIRTIKPEFWDSEKLARLDYGARLLFIGLWNFADDSGRLRGGVSWISGKVLPYDPKAPVEAWLKALEEIGAVRRYEVSGESYLEIPNFLKHQRIEKPSESRLPPFQEDSGRIPGGVTTGTGNREQGMEQGTGTPHTPQGGDGFDGFWSAYPRKIGKGAALRLWKKIRPSKELQARILEAIKAQHGSRAWTKDSGQYIPNPATWLNQGRWEDEVDRKQGILGNL